MPAACPRPLTAEELQAARALGLDEYQAVGVVGVVGDGVESCKRFVIV